ncbi:MULTISPECIES: hypothetical protein [Paraburkholderia]|uniref:hypothetical protein n=1 Tax=Paraburkholderia TaxID=1822464 RepID=UPI000366AE05|nr:MULTISPECIES: hypothetical protein [Paraburkholderia]MDH6153316.1 hypothetical protein [Paraburkholderia sp. WSM4179]
MHDIGSSRPTAWGPGYNEFEQELVAGSSGELTQEFESEFAGELESEFELGENEFENEFESEVSGEMQEMELAAELLAVSNEQEMEQFLGGLVKSIGRAATNFAKSSAGKALGGILRSAAKSALPIVGSALGNFVVPGAGGVIGGKLASMAGSALGLELEGLSNEDREFEVARRLVRIGRHATHHLVSMPPNVPPARAARIAFLRAARQVAPGLLPAMRAISRNTGVGPAAAGRTGTPSPMPIFGPPARTGLPTRYGAGYGTSYGTEPLYDGAPGMNGTMGTTAALAPASAATTSAATCPSCGTSVATGIAHHGTWRRSRNGRAIILYLAPNRSSY